MHAQWLRQRAGNLSGFEEATAMRHSTPLGAVVRGALAGAIGIVAMDGFLFARARSQGNHQPPLEWEFAGPSSWDAVSAPGQIGRRLYEGYVQRPLDERWARLTNNVMHWGYGIAWGTALGVVAGSMSQRRILTGPVFGATVWASSYVTLPLAGLYKPISQYSAKELAPDLAAHLVYGTASAVALALLP
jgi:hypothetical protein